MDNIFGKNFIDGYVPDILELLSNLSSDEVFTPPKIVNQILDTLPSKIWNDKSLKFLDPGCKSGVFLREISKRLMKGLVKDFPEEGERRYHIFKNMLYGNAITQLTSLISRRTLYYTKEPNQKDYSVVQFKDNDGNIRYKQTDHLYENKKKCVYCNASLEEYDRAKKGRETHAYDFIHRNEIFKNMKFDVIIGNPPYQLGDGGFGASASPIYQKFIDQAKKMGARYVAMIVPARWYSGGKGLDEFRDEMMKDKRMKILVDYPDASECFPGVEIKGGVCYFLWDSEYNGKCKISRYFNGEIISTDERSLDEFPTFVRFNEAVPILRKVVSTKELIDKKTLANLKIKCIILKHSNILERMTYAEELQYLVGNEKRNKFISDLLLHLNGNTLCLFQLVEKHGKVLYDLVNDVAKDRKVFFVYGGVDGLERERIRGIVENEKDAIIIASYGTFSTGINIRNINNIVFASPSKSKIRVLQSLGRGLRRSESKMDVRLFDLSDDIKQGSRQNYTLSHFTERLNIYNEEQFNYEISKVKLK